jgi:hypothetical protein
VFCHHCVSTHQEEGMNRYGLSQISHPAVQPGSVWRVVDPTNPFEVMHVVVVKETVCPIYIQQDTVIVAYHALGQSDHESASYLENFLVEYRVDEQD